MFEELKQKIRQEIGNEKATNMNHKIAQKLRCIGDDALNKHDYEKYISCYEIIAEDIDEYEQSIGGVSKSQSGAVLAYEQVLTKYVDCGYTANSEVLELAEQCRATIDELMGADAMWPSVDASLIDCMCAINVEKYYMIIEKYAKLDFFTGLNLYKQNPDFPMAEAGLRFGSASLAKLYIYKGKYKEAYEILIQIPKNQLYPEQIAYLGILEIYKLTGQREMTNNQIDELLDILETWASKGSPEASWVLGIMIAEGYIYSKDIDAVKQHFKNAENFIEKLKGNAGRSDFDFKVFSPISQDEIIKQAEAGIYHSKFYKAKHKNDSIQMKKQENVSYNNTENTNSDSSGGCYVATAVYGSYDCPEVWTLRRYRDNQLSKTWYGRLFIYTYYKISPVIVKFFGDTKWFKNMWRGKLDKIVKKLQNSGVEDTPYNDIDW